MTADRFLRYAAAAAASAVPVGYLKYVGLGGADKIFSFAVLLYLLAFTFMALFQRQPHLPLPAGRVIAIVPFYNGDAQLLHDSIRSLLNGSVVPDVIHVVDDGSASAPPVFDHPRVVWHRQANAGKHHAQARALRAELSDGLPFDYVVTVDDDSVVDRYAVERLLRRMSDPRINGATGVVYAINRAKSIITKVTDLHYVHSCLIVRQGLSAKGDVFTTSGALAVYRAQVWLDNIDEYLERGNADDRHLAHICQRTGLTAAVPDAFVYTHAPDNAPDLFRQRIRWARDYYRMLALDLRYLQGWSLWMRGTDFALMCLAPVLALTALMVFPFAQWRVPVAGVALWVFFLYTQTFAYVLERRGVALRHRLWAWLAYTPVLYFLQIALIGPAMLVALINLRHPSWQTRNAKESIKAKIGGGRSRWLDLLRTVAIFRVVTFHATGWGWLSYLFPSMGIMFGLAGSLMARSLTKVGDRAELAVWSRVKRLLPAVWLLGALLIPTMLFMGWDGDDARPFNEAAVIAWIFPLSDPPGNDWAAPMTGVLWYIRTYLWLVLLSPALWASFRRWPVATTVLPLGLIAVAPLVAPVSTWGSDILTSLGTYTPCWVLGFWHATGRLRSAPFLKILSFAVVCAGISFTWTRFYPPEQGSLQESPLGQALWSAAFILLLLRYEPKLDWLRKLKPLDWLVSKMNSRAVTIYLWHQLAIISTAPLLAASGVFEHGPVASWSLKMAMVWAGVILACFLFGRVEDLTSPTKRDAHASADLGRTHPEVAHAITPRPEPGQTAVIQLAPPRAAGAVAHVQTQRIRRPGYPPAHPVAHQRQPGRSQPARTMAGDRGWWTP
ncbi:acyltransferase family protein [Actinoplanes sp. NPDC024001]|uniref:acyltransferase family protein n=1 Tax=Actinoplanes sp. NPDC024001 TaxID=3154598 RepID=UPI0033EBF512